MDLRSIRQKYNSINPTAKAALWYTICNVLMKGISLLSTPIFTRILSESEYGTFAIFQSWFDILIIFTSLNAFLGGYTKGLILYKDDRDGFTSSSLGLTTTITIIVGLICILFSEFWNKVFELPTSLMIALLIELLLMPAIDFWIARERFDYRYKKYVIVTLGMSASSILVAVIAVITSEHKGDARIYSDVVVKAMFCLAFFFKIIKAGKKWYSRIYWRYNISYNLPLIPHYLSMYVLSQSDRLMIGRMIGSPQAAFYSVAYTIATMMNLIMSAINNALNPYIYKSIAVGETRRITKATSPLFILMAMLSILTMALAPEIIYIFASEKYAEAIYVIPPVSAAVFFIFVYSMFSSVTFYFQKTKLIAIATTLSAVINLGLNYIFIKLYGYYAAGYTTLFCYVFLAFLHYVLYKRISKEKIHDKEEIFSKRTVLLCSLMVIVTMLIMACTYQIRIVRYVFVVILLLFLFLYRNRFITIIMGVKNDKYK